MAFEDVMGTMGRLSASLDAMAAIGAYLALGDEGDERTRAAFADVAKAAGAGDLDELEPPQRAMAQNFVNLYFALARELLESPARPAGWTFTDPVVLEGMGRGSSMLPPLMAKSIEGLADVKSFLDVGTGVGWLAISAANTWPEASVVGLDIWDVSLERARAHVAESGLEGRVEIRKQNVMELDDAEAYDGAWLPTFFFTNDILRKAVDRVVAALRPGGTLVFGRYTPAEEPLARAAEILRTVRGGGDMLSVDEATKVMESAGLTDVREVEHGGQIPVHFIIGRKP